MDVEDKMGEEKTSAGTTIKRFCFCFCFCNKKGVTGSANG